MFYKVLYVIISLIVCLLTYYVANALVVSNNLISVWRNASETKDFKAFLGWSTKYKDEPFLKIDNGNCKIDVYLTYSEGTDNDQTVSASGYNFIIHDVNSETVKYNTENPGTTDAVITFTVGEKTVDVGYYSYEFANIYTVSQIVYTSDTSSSDSINELFKSQDVEEYTAFDKVEFKDIEGNVYASIDNLSSSVDLSDLSEWQNGFTEDEINAYYRPKTYWQVWVAVIVAAIILGGLFVLIFYRKKKERLFLSDSEKYDKQKNETKKASEIKEENVSDIIDEDKIEDDDVDENSLL